MKQLNLIINVMSQYSRKSSLFVLLYLIPLEKNMIIVRIKISLFEFLNYVKFRTLIKFFLGNPENLKSKDFEEIQAAKYIDESL